MTPLLSIRGLHIDARRAGVATPLLHGLDLDLHAGRCTGLVGESGSGKSLTALALLGLLPPGLHARGVLQVEGADVPLGAAAHAALRGRTIAWVPQDPLASLHPLRTVQSQLVETLRSLRSLPASDARREAHALLDRVQLPDAGAALRKRPHEFSGGQRQRIAIALALACAPRVLIADEPTSALDARIARDILDLLDALRREDGLALLLISHDLPLVGAYAQQVCVLHRGVVVEHGDTTRVFAAPAHAYTRALLDADLAGDAPPIATDAPVALQADALRVTYPRAPRPALDDVALTLHRGQALALVGESGSGKSTLGRVLLRLLHGAQGRVQLVEADGSTLDFTALDGRALRAARARIGIVFQDPYASLDPRLTVADIVSEPLRIHGIGTAAERHARAERLMLDVGLDATMLQRRPHEFSGGQRQRIAIARALATDPALLVCDEAVSALDAHHRGAILALLARLKRERGLAVLFVTHDLHAARVLCERIAVLEHGRIVEQGATAQVLAAPAHAHTRALVDARPRAHAASA